MAETIRVDCYSATYVSDDNVNKNYGAATTIYLGSSSTPAEYRHAYMQFNLPNLTGRKITAAKLCMYLVSSAGGFPASAYVFPYYTSQNVESAITHAERNKYGTRGGEISKSLRYIKAGTWADIDITSQVTSNNSGNAYFSFYITAGTGYTSFTTPGRNQPNKAYLEITVENSTPEAPTLLYPVDTIMENMGTTAFRWNYNNYWGGTQFAYVLEWKMKYSDTWNRMEGGTAQEHWIDASIFQIGQVEWRLLTYNSTGVASPYASATFSVVGKPRAPIITEMKNSAISHIRWSSSEAEQDVYELEIQNSQGTVIYRSGMQPSGLENIHYPNYIFSAGNYVVQMRIRSVYNKWSDWGSRQFVLSFSAPQIPQIQVSVIKYGIRILPQFTAEKAFLYRSSGVDAIPIAKLQSGKEYLDYTIQSGTIYTYFIRAVSSGLSDSEKRIVKNTWSGICISSTEKPEEIVNIHTSITEEYIKKTTGYQKESTLVNYIGREYPVLESGEFLGKNVSFGGFLHTKEKGILCNIFNRKNPVWVRDGEESSAFDISEISFINDFFDRGFTVSLSFSRIHLGQEVNIYD